MSKYINASLLRDALMRKSNEMREKIKPGAEYESGYWAGLTYAIWSVEDMPAADMEPVKHGKWINRHDRLVKCSLCGESVQTNWRGFFCQNCGAKMDGR